MEIKDNQFLYKKSDQIFVNSLFFCLQYQKRHYYQLSLWKILSNANLKDFFAQLSKKKTNICQHPLQIISFALTSKAKIKILILL